jgi:hypothetical protein
MSDAKELLGKLVRGCWKRCRTSWGGAGSFLWWLMHQRACSRRLEGICGWRMSFKNSWISSCYYSSASSGISSSTTPRIK